MEGLFHRLYPQLDITNEPRRQKCGAPDFVVQRHGVPLGYIEAKDLGKDLSADEYKEQFGRYRCSLDNLLITDYLHWQRGELVLETRIGDYQKGQPVKARPQDYAFAALLQVLASAQGLVCHTNMSEQRRTRRSLNPQSNFFVALLCKQHRFG